MMPGLADHLAAPPAAYSHLPYDARNAAPAETLLSVKPANIRLLACKQSWDGQALIVRLHEAAGRMTKAELSVAGRSGPGDRPGLVRGKRRPAKKDRGQLQVTVPLAFAPFEIKTLRIEKDGRATAVRLIEEDRP